MDIVDRLRCGSVLHLKRWSGDTHFDLGGSVDEGATDAVMDEAADEIERLNDLTDRMFQQIEQLISDIVDSREETRRHQRHIDRLIGQLTDFADDIERLREHLRITNINWANAEAEYKAVLEALREEVER